MELNALLALQFNLPSIPKVVALLQIKLPAPNTRIHIDRKMCSDLGEGSRCCAGYSFVGALFTVSCVGDSLFVIGVVVVLVLSFYWEFVFEMNERIKNLQ